MEYHRIDHIETVADYLAAQIKKHLDEGEHVLWLVSGGSGIEVGCLAAQKLAGTDLTNLAVTLTDERYGDIGHADENWQQLLDSGFALPGALLYRPLTGEARDVTATRFGDWLAGQIERADYSIGLFGIGTDGHTAGIKPDSAAIGGRGWAIDFTGEDFERITMTFPAIEALDEVVVQAFGEGKAVVLHQLLNDDTSPETSPMQVLKQVRKSTLFTDVEEA